LREFTLSGADFLRRVATPDAGPVTDGPAPLAGKNVIFELFFAKPNNLFFLANDGIREIGVYPHH
jgi:hypothetical protein